MNPGTCELEQAGLNAAGVPMITPLPEISFDRFTLLPGEFSTRTSRSGTASPFCTKAGAVLWNGATRGMVARGARVARRRAANMVDVYVRLGLSTEIGEVIERW